LDCIEVIKKKMAKEMSREEYYLALMELHEKYPMTGHDPALTPFQLKNYKKKRIQPKNFQESAEMFARHQKKLAEEFLPLEIWKRREWPLFKLLEGEYGGKD
jgi:hypothetical protein